MNIQRLDDQIIITLPNTVGITDVERIISFLLYQEATKEKDASQEEVDQFAREVNKAWWEKNKDLFLNK